MEEGRKAGKKRNQSQPTGLYPNLLSLLYTTGELRIPNTYQKYIHTYKNYIPIHFKIPSSKIPVSSL